MTSSIPGIYVVIGTNPDRDECFVFETIGMANPTRSNAESALMLAINDYKRSYPLAAADFTMDDLDQIPCDIYERHGLRPFWTDHMLAVSRVELDEDGSRIA